MEFNVEVDARQLACPLPILRAKKALSQMVSGEVLKLVATDKGAPLDFMVFCENTSNTLLSSLEENGEFIFLIRRR
ncbi:MAG: sulfurtransferase TusA family protein [Gallionella sp.]|nr:sulfurtransferase TusA family protein [Gallionella sp.]